MDIVLKYFPGLSAIQKERMAQLENLYRFWNQQINVISRKDIDGLYEKHVLHSLAIGKIVRFTAGTRILDVGTGGGFPGIPLAILFPDVKFRLIDSIGKKIKVVSAVADELKLGNLSAEQIRVEEVKEEYDFVVSRAVTDLPRFQQWVGKNVSRIQQNALPNGILYLKGGEIDDEIKRCTGKAQVYPLNEIFDEPFFQTKLLVYLPVRQEKRAFDKINQKKQEEGLFF